MKKTVYILIAVIIIAILGYAIMSKSNSDIAPTAQPDTNTVTDTATDVQVTGQSASTATSTNGAPNTSTNANQTYTLAEVSKHNSAKDCWIAINGKVYNATQFIASGGHNSKILQGCGKDASTIFASINKHQGSKAMGILPTLFIGNLK